MVGDGGCGQLDDPPWMLAPNAARVLLPTGAMAPLDARGRQGSSARGAFGACSRLRCLGVWAIVALLGCGRSGLLADDLGAATGSDAPAGTSGGEEAHPDDDATAPGLDDGAGAMFDDGSTIARVPDADADTDGGPIGFFPNGRCGPATCDGCCRSDGFCVASFQNGTPAFCGLGGRKCISCAPGDECRVDVGIGTAGKLTREHDVHELRSAVHL